MSWSAPTRRLSIRCLSAQAPVRCPVQRQQQRTALFGRGKPGSGSGSDNTSSSDPASNPVLEDYRRRNADTDAKGQRPPAQILPAAGDIAASSIFEDERRIQEQESRDDENQAEDGTPARDPAAMARILRPDPNARERWERKKVIQMVRKGGRLSKEQFIKRTEREHVVKSHNMKTSIKKLGMLARQIAGKTLDDAIVQMRFSKKKVALDVLKQLEAARDEAIVMRGMGLGSASSSADADSSTETSSAITEETDVEVETPKATKKDRGLEIQLKDGKRHKVTDQSKIYIDQAWVGRGPYGKLPDYRARGQMNMMRTPWTSLSVVLKEEATRVREWEEREAKRRKKITEQVWTALPDRPIQIQRQWYSW